MNTHLGTIRTLFRNYNSTSSSHLHTYFKQLGIWAEDVLVIALISSFWAELCMYITLNLMCSYCKTRLGYHIHLRHSRHIRFLCTSQISCLSLKYYAYVLTCLTSIIVHRYLSSITWQFIILTMRLSHTMNAMVRCCSWQFLCLVLTFCVMLVYLIRHTQYSLSQGSSWPFWSTDTPC